MQKILESWINPLNSLFDTNQKNLKRVFFHEQINKITNKEQIILIYHVVTPQNSILSRVLFFVETRTKNSFFLFSILILSISSIICIFAASISIHLRFSHLNADPFIPLAPASSFPKNCNSSSLDLIVSSALLSNASPSISAIIFSSKYGTLYSSSIGSFMFSQSQDLDIQNVPSNLYSSLYDLASLSKFVINCSTLPKWWLISWRFRLFWSPSRFFILLQR